MADITDPQAIKFTNEQLRPLCEAARALRAKVDAMSVDWFAGLNLLFPNDESPVDDGREADGVSRLTGADVNAAVGNLQESCAALNEQIISKPCVRPLQVS